MTTTNESQTIYCVKCKEKTDNVDGSVEKITMKNGRDATRSICANCGTKKFRIGT